LTSEKIRAELKEEVTKLRESDRIQITLAVILVGERKDSATYVRCRARFATTQATDASTACVADKRRKRAKMLALRACNTRFLRPQLRLSHRSTSLADSGASGSIVGADFRAEQGRVCARHSRAAAAATAHRRGPRYSVDRH